ncbi:MAG TPA: asparagine synthase (glutamine-hydrolyzing) [Pyrinomonadaceae bacterium]|jgi:asparagine synthase (glutamine-hydrolysing)
MCGIAGIVGLKDAETALRKLNVMNESLRHRGPDATGVFVEEGIALGHLRLSIIDLSEAANQPFFDRSGRFSIIFNGEIYNYRDIKRSLPEYPFRTDSDTEVILAAFEKHGAECLSLLNGMFALAIWDRERRELFIARDRLGVKPFYYAQADGVFVFASEIRALLNSQLVPHKLSQQGVYDYLSYQSVYAPETIVENVFQLPAGGFGIFKDGKLTNQTYWRLEEQTLAPVAEDERTIKQDIKNLLLNSVEQRMISDVRLGAFLSGGIDSSAVVALMSEVSEKPVETFSVTFGEKDFDESIYANLIAQKYKTNHQNVFLTADDFLRELPEALRATDSPSGDGINTYVVSKATRQTGIKVALSGLGGDELFAGYPNFLNWYKTVNGIFPKIPAPFRKSLAFAFSRSNDSRRQRIGDLIAADKINITEIYPLFRQVMSQRIVEDLYKNGQRGGGIHKILKDKEKAIEKFPILSQFSLGELFGYTQNVLLKDADQYSMASALEVREPFFDYRLVEYALAIPDRIKYPKYPKSLLVEAIYPMLPEKIVHRKKMGFVLPFDRWMRNELKDFCELRLNNLAARGIFDADKLLAKWVDFQNGKNGVLWSHLWHLVVLTEWLENNKF